MMQMLEVSVELQPYVGWILGSEEEEDAVTYMGAGPSAAKPDATALQVAKALADEIAPQTATISIIETARISASATADLARTMRDSTDRLRSIIDGCRLQTQTFSYPYDSPPVPRDIFVDLMDFAEILALRCRIAGDTGTADLADRVALEVHDMVAYSKHWGGAWANANGLSIFFPDSEATRVKSHAVAGRFVYPFWNYVGIDPGAANAVPRHADADYTDAGLGFCAAHQWDEFLRAYLVCRKLRISAAGLASGVYMGGFVPAADHFGKGDGFTPLSRDFPADRMVTITAPFYAYGKTFTGWSIDGAAPANSNTTLDIIMDKDHTAVAQYFVSAAAYSKQLKNGDAVSMESALVSQAGQGEFWIVADDRSSGLWVQGLATGVSPGQRVSLDGVMRTDASGERYIEATGVTVVASMLAEDATVVPLSMRNKTLGGGDFQYDPVTGAGQCGVAGGSGLNNIGLLVAACGRVTHTSAGFFYIDDGSNLRDGSAFSGLRVATPGLQSPPVGAFVSVTGISSCYKVSGNVQRLLKVGSQADIVIL